MTIDKTIESILAQVPCPLLNKTATELGLNPSLTIEKNHLTLALCAGFPSGFLKETLQPTLTLALQHALPQYEVNVIVDHAIKAHVTQLPGKGLRSVKNTIAIASGKGGVGKSTVAVNLATALARSGARVGLLDADIYGPSIPLMLGPTAPIKVHGERYLPVSAHGVQAMSIGYLTSGEPALIWRGPMLAKSLIQMIDITQWDELDYLFIDLPPGTGDIQLSLVQKIPLAGALIVTTPQQVATLDAEKAIKMFAKTNIDVLGLIENMSTHVCSKCGHHEAIFSSGGAKHLCESYAVPLLGQWPLDRQISTHSDQGTPTSATGNSDLTMMMIKSALEATIELSKKSLNYANKFPNILVE